MAATSTWRTSLNLHQFCKQLKENNAKDSLKKIAFDSKELIVTTYDGDLFVWDAYSSHMVYFRLKNLLPEAKEKAHRYQILQCTDSPRFDVEGLIINQSASHIIVWGLSGIKVVELPRRYGRYGEFEGGKDIVSCRTIQIAERYFASQQGVRLREAAWHPGSSSDSHIVLLTSDNVLSIYDLADPEKAMKTFDLDSGSRFDFNPSPTKIRLSSALGETAVSFDFGPATELKTRQRLGVSTLQETLPVWPVYIVKGNGDVMVVYTSLRFTRNEHLPVQGPLMMCPPADDNYGLDACTIRCLNISPPVVVIATCEGKLHHCVVMATEDDDISISGHSSLGPTPNASIYEPVLEPTLWVYESVELELSLTTTDINDDRPIEDDFSCPIRIIKDPCTSTRYHCCHGAGVHSVALPWLSCVHRFLTGDNNESSLPHNQECVVEHLVCTKPLPSSPAAPILGLDIITDPSLSPTLLSLTSDYEFVALPLSTKSSSLNEPRSLLSDSPGPAVTSPLRQLNREPFDQHIAKILLRNSSHPVLKSGPKSELSQQECFQLLTRATQVFREEYIQKQDLARQEIETRVRILHEQKKQQQRDINSLSQSRNILQDKGEGLASKLNSAQESQDSLLRRLDQIMRKIQSRVPMLSDAEKHMLRELKTLKGNLDTFAKKLQQVKIKQDFQARTAAGDRQGPGSPAIQKAQIGQLQHILKQEGEEIADLMKKITQLKMETNS
ncbi:nucleoporin 88-like [Haliotis asinina]|uniref:nucleoporin 88-like n=1 Tax=Haliotis asinina TaxID=109174 RepID=UPI0035321724